MLPRHKAEPRNAATQRPRRGSCFRAPGQAAHDPAAARRSTLPTTQPRGQGTCTMNTQKNAAGQVSLAKRDRPPKQEDRPCHKASPFRQGVARHAEAASREFTARPHAQRVFASANPRSTACARRGTRHRRPRGQDRRQASGDRARTAWRAARTSKRWQAAGSTNALSLQKKPRHRAQAKAAQPAPVERKQMVVPASPCPLADPCWPRTTGRLALGRSGEEQTPRKHRGPGRKSGLVPTTARSTAHSACCTNAASANTHT